LLFYFASPA